MIPIAANIQSIVSPLETERKLEEYRRLMMEKARSLPSKYDATIAGTNYRAEIDMSDPWLGCATIITRKSINHKRGARISFKLNEWPAPNSFQILEVRAKRRPRPGKQAGFLILFDPRGY